MTRQEKLGAIAVSMDLLIPDEGKSIDNSSQNFLTLWILQDYWKFSYFGTETV